MKPNEPRKMNDELSMVFDGAKENASLLKEIAELEGFAYFSINAQILDKAKVGETKNLFLAIVLRNSRVTESEQFQAHLRDQEIPACAEVFTFANKIINALGVDGLKVSNAPRGVCIEGSVSSPQFTEALNKVLKSSNVPDPVTKKLNFGNLPGCYR